jgi:cell division protein FtsL
MNISITILVSMCSTLALVLIIGIVLIKQNVLSVNSAVLSRQSINSEEQMEFNPLAGAKADTYYEEQIEETLPDTNDKLKDFALETDFALKQFLTAFENFETSINKGNYEDAIVRMGEFNTSINRLRSKMGLHQMDEPYEMTVSSMKSDLNEINFSLDMEFSRELTFANSNEYNARGLRAKLSLLKSKVDTINDNYQSLLSEQTSSE